ncbi:unnamed protein product, partial [Discosporangium mesarthrocarpum]
MCFYFLMNKMLRRNAGLFVTRREHTEQLNIFYAALYGPLRGFFFFLSPAPTTRAGNCGVGCRACGDSSYLVVIAVAAGHNHFASVQPISWSLSSILKFRTLSRFPF